MDRRSWQSVHVGNVTVELSSRANREAALKKLEGDNSKLDTAAGKLKVQRAKTSFQRKRNTSMGNAFEALKKDSRCQNKSVELVWKMDGTKDRGVKVGNDMIFLQTPFDLVGSFKAPFNDILL